MPVSVSGTWPPASQDDWPDLPKVYYIIQVDDKPIEVEIPEAGFYQLLKGSRGIGQSKRHSVALIEPQQLCSKHGHWFALLIHLNLLVPRLQVKQGEPLGPLQAVEGLIDAG